MGIKDIGKWITGENVDNEIDDDVDFTTPTSEFETSGVEGMGSSEYASKQSQMVVFEPRSYSESQGIADHLKNRRGCIINLHRVSKDQAKRIIDFLSGVVYAIEGDVQKIGPNVFLCTPSNFGVYGEISDESEE